MKTKLLFSISLVLSLPAQANNIAEIVSALVAPPVIKALGKKGYITNVTYSMGEVYMSVNTGISNYPESAEGNKELCLTIDRNGNFSKEAGECWNHKMRR